MAHAAIGIGSSLGDRRRTVRAAIAALETIPRTRVRAISALHDTPPVGGVAQKQFINACVVVETALPPEKLLAAMLKIEEKFGRTRTVRWDDRPLDLDLLLYEDRVSDDPFCTIPHPRLHERAFVLEPLAEIAPDWVHPVLLRTIAHLAENLPPDPSPTGE